MAFRPLLPLFVSYHEFFRRSCFGAKRETVSLGRQSLFSTCLCRCVLACLAAASWRIDDEFVQRPNLTSGTDGDWLVVVKLEIVYGSRCT